jgi:hypothetical protein
MTSENYTSEQSVVITWRCLNLNKIITVDPTAIMNKQYGWVCDCVNNDKTPLWTFGKDRHHRPLRHGVRSVFDAESFDDDNEEIIKNLVRAKPETIIEMHLCEDCFEWYKKTNGRWVYDTGMWICYNCYPKTESYKKNDFY